MGTFCRWITLQDLHLRERLEAPLIEHMSPSQINLTVQGQRFSDKSYSTAKCTTVSRIRYSIRWLARTSAGLERAYSIRTWGRWGRCCRGGHGPFWTDFLRLRPCCTLVEAIWRVWANFMTIFFCVRSLYLLCLNLNLNLTFFYLHLTSSYI